jgi:hypothetical protein
MNKHGAKSALEAWVGIEPTKRLARFWARLLRCFGLFCDVLRVAVGGNGYQIATGSRAVSHV